MHFLHCLTTLQLHGRFKGPYSMIYLSVSDEDVHKMIYSCSKLLITFFDGSS